MSTAPTRTLIVGSGAREHALAWKLAGEPGMNEVYVAPGSAAIAAEPRVRCLPAVDPLDPASVLGAARAVSAELVVIGPEAPLAAGVSDAVSVAGIPVFGPSMAAAAIETSKAFCRDVAAAAGVRIARGQAFKAGEVEAARAFVRELGAEAGGVVLKQDGLAAGKGVSVYDDVDRAVEDVPSFLDARGPGPVLVIEEKLVGYEASVIAICDGSAGISLPPSRDHKRLLDDDAGPNTGGMGAYSPLFDLPDEAGAEIVRTVHMPILDELSWRGLPFVGFLYAGLMLTSDGPVLLECNARLGDPEAQVILPRLPGALGPSLAAAVYRSGLTGAAAWHRGRIAGERGFWPTLPGATVGIVLASEGYPGAPAVGRPIEGLEAATRDGALVFHGGSAGRPDGGYATSGGRVLTVVGRGPDLARARAAAEAAADRISWAGLQRRRDIAADPPGAPLPRAWVAS